MPAPLAVWRKLADLLRHSDEPVAEIVQYGEPTTTCVLGSPPRVDRHHRPQRAADHPPRALRLAAGDDDVDLLRLEDLDDVVGLRAPPRRVWLDAGHGAR